MVSIFKKSIAMVFYVSVLSLVLQSCMMPSVGTNSSAWNGGFPSSTTETHTKTTIVSPPSYATVNIPPPAIMQGQPMVQQPMMYQQQSAPVQANPCQTYQSNTCYAPSQVGANDPCAYQISMPQQMPARYTIAIPPAPSPQYTIALPQGDPPQYAVVQQQPHVSTTTPVQLKVNDRCE